MLGFLERRPARNPNFRPKVQNGENEHFLAKIMILVKFAKKAEIYLNFIDFSLENKAKSASSIFLIILSKFLEILEIPGFFVIFMKISWKSWNCTFSHFCDPAYLA